MSFHFIKDATDIEIPSPVFGDIRRVDSQAIKRRTRNGDLKIYTDTANWPVIIVHQYQFTLIKDTVASDLITQLKTFFTTNAGLEITITNHLDNSYDGVILTPAQEIIYTRPPCSQALSIEFMEKMV